jgi:hypothetical protein
MSVAPFLLATHIEREKREMSDPVP